MRKISAKRCFLISAAVLLTAALVIAGGIMLFGKKTVGKAVKKEKVYDFYYTVSTSTFPPHFQRYRFTAEDGKYLFRHETREGDHIPLTEADTTVSGTLELTEEQWNRFFELMEGGTVRNRTESLDSGYKGPFLYLYWTGDRGKCQQFEFESYGKQKEFEEFCLELKELTP